MRVRSILSALVVAGAVFGTSAVLLTGSRDPNPASAVPGGPLTARQQVERAESVVRSDPGNALAWANLASAALSRAKETADPSWYSRSDDAARRALALDPTNVLALEATGTLANARHRFADAVAPAQAARRGAPDRFAALEILTDARIELGRYREGFATANERLRLRPDLASYSRASYAAELRGERDLAVRLMAQAVDSGRPGSGDRAWAQVQLALLRLGGGDLAGARREIDAALAATPGDATVIAGDAHVRAASGDLAGAAAGYRRALEVQRVAGYATSLAEIEAVRGDAAAARAALALARRIDEREAAHGVKLELDQAAVEADFSRPGAAEVAKVLRAHRDRPGVVGDDAVGWVLTRAGRCDAGLRYARRSLRLGTRDASMFFHAGMAARCAGDRDEAIGYLRSAVELNPRFSVRWSGVARRVLAELTRSR